MRAVLSRRHVTAGFGAALAAPLIGRAHAAAGAITVAAYSGIFEENYRAAVIEPFMRANPGISVTYYSMGSSAQTLGILRSQRAAPQVDVVLFDVSVAKGATDDGLLDSIDDLPVLKELFPRAFTKGVAGAAGTFDNFVLLYAPDRVRPAPASWKVLWDKAYRDQIAVAAAPDIVGISFTLMANKAFGGGDYRQSVETGLAAIAEMAPLVLSWNPTPDAYSFIINGTAALGVGWNARGQLYSGLSQGRLAVAIPDEGSLFQINNMCLVKDAPNAAAARVFIEYALGAAAQKSFTERMFYAPVTAKAEIGAAALARTASSPERLARMLDIDWLEIARIRDGITEQWRRRILTRR
jgi:putative spermidine/putrescine transport system substrate-binding protein